MKDKCKECIWLDTFDGIHFTCRKYFGKCKFRKPREKEFVFMYNNKKVVIHQCEYLSYEDGITVATSMNDGEFGFHSGSSGKLFKNEDEAKEFYIECVEIHELVKDGRTTI